MMKKPDLQSLTEPSWVRAWRGDKKALPKSHGRAIDHARTTECRLSAAIATHFGDRKGDLDVLEAGIDKLLAGESVICQVCGFETFKTGHKPGCQLYQWYELVQKEPCSMDVSASVKPDAAGA